MPVNNPGPPLVWTIPTGSPSAAAWLAASASSGLGPWSNELYVDNVRGNDVTGQRGNMNLPFATIQAALNAMLTDDVIYVAEQVFVLSAPLTVPASVIKGTVYGSMQGIGNAGNPSAVATGRAVLSPIGAGVLTSYWNLGANLGLNAWNIGFFYMGFSPGHSFSPTVADILADGSAYAAGTFLTNGLTLDHAKFFDAAPAAVSLKYVGTFDFETCDMAFPISIVSCGNGRTRRTNGTTINITNDASDSLDPGNGGISLRWNSNFSGLVTMTAQAQVRVDQTSSVGGFKGSALSVNGARVPALQCSGYIGNQNTAVLDFASAGAELPDTATVLAWNLAGARLYQASNTDVAVGPTTVQFKVGGAAGNFQTVKLDSSTALPGVTFTADAKIHLTMRGAVAPQAVYATPGADGDIIPPAINGTIDISAGGAVAKTWAQLGYTPLVRTGVAPTTCLVSSGAALADAFVPNAGKAVTGFTITSIAAAGNVANWEARF